MTVSVFNCFVERGNVDWRLLSIAHGMDFFLLKDIFALLPQWFFQVMMIDPRSTQITARKPGMRKSFQVKLIVSVRNPAGSLVYTQR